MKKIWCLLLIIVLCFPTFSLAENIDLSSMTINELVTLLNRIKTEVEIKTASSQDGMILVNEENGTTIYLTGVVKEGSFYIDEFNIGLAIVNDGNAPLECGCEIYINGWDAGHETLLSDSLEPGRKKKTSMSIYLSRANMSKPYSLDNVTTLELRFYEGSYYSKTDM